MTSSAVRVGIAPPERWESSRGLFSSLESLLSVSIEPWHRGRDDPETVLWFGGEPSRLQSAVPSALPVFARVGELGRSAEPATLTFTSSQRLDRRLRGIQLKLSALRTGTIQVQRGDEVLALADQKPVWVQRSVNGETVDLVGIEPGDVNGKQPITWRQDFDTITTMVPLIHFLRGVVSSGTTATPRLRACFLIDDPNLRWPTYGYVHYQELGAEAAEHGYHVSISTIPLDGRFANPKTVRLFKRHHQELSLSIQGNNHTYREFGSSSAPRQLRSVAQAIRRIERFERSTGLEVDRVAVPPHGTLALQGLEAAAHLGLDAVAVSPWGIPESIRRPGTSAGFYPTLLGPNGISLLVRRHLTAEPAWLALHAFLDQPLIIYLHHGDLAGGLGVLNDVARRVNELGSVEWCSLGDVTRSSYVVTTDGEVATVRMYTSHVRVQLPDGVSSVIVDHPRMEPGSPVRVVDSRGPAGGKLGCELPVLTDQPLDITVYRSCLDPYSVAAPVWQPWPIMRRVATETRDRLSPVLRR